MPQYSTLASEAGDRVISTIKTAQELAVSAVSQVSNTVGGVIPSIPLKPITDLLPHPADLTKTYFDFAEELLKTQKAYALDIIHALEPVTGKVLPNGKSRKTTKKSVEK